MRASPVSQTRPVLDASHRGAVCAKIPQELGHSVAHTAEIRDHDTGPVLADPFGVVPLLRQRPRVTLDDHRQAHRDCLADAPRPRLADEEIREPHVVRDLLRESFDKARRALRHLPELSREPLGPPADQDELHIPASRSAISIITFEPWPPNNTSPVGWSDPSEAGCARRRGRSRAARKSSGGESCPRSSESGSPPSQSSEPAPRPSASRKITHCCCRSSQEVRRIVGEICQNGHEGHTRQRPRETRMQSAVEVRDQRYHKAGSLLFPVVFEQPNRRFVVSPDHGMHELQSIRRPPASSHAPASCYKCPEDGFR